MILLTYWFAQKYRGNGDVFDILKFLIFEILPMLIDYRILWWGNTVEMAGGWHKYHVMSYQS